MKKRLMIGLEAIVLSVCLNTFAGTKEPSIYEQTIEDTDYVILGVKDATAADKEMGYEDKNVAIHAVRGNRKTHDLLYPLSMIPEKDKAYLKRGNIMQVHSLTNLTFIPENKYVRGRKIQAYMADYWITDGDYKVYELEVFGGYKPTMVRFGLKRLQDNQEFYGFNQNDFELGPTTCFKNGDIVRVVGGGKTIITPKVAQK